MFQTPVTNVSAGDASQGNAYDGHARESGSCTVAYGIKGMKLVGGVEISTMKKLTQWTIESDKVINFKI